MIDEQAQQNHGHRFLTGLVVGGVIGVGLAIVLAPRLASELRGRAVDSAKSLGAAASGHYRDTRVRVTDAVAGLTRKAQGARDGVCDVVARGAQEVQQYATDAKTHAVV